jgi:hypothetical protein
MHSQAKVRIKKKIQNKIQVSQDLTPSIAPFLPPLRGGGGSRPPKEIAGPNPFGVRYRAIDLHQGFALMHSQAKVGFLFLHLTIQLPLQLTESSKGGFCVIVTRFFLV